MQNIDLIWRYLTTDRPGEHKRHAYAQVAAVAVSLSLKDLCGLVESAPAWAAVDLTRRWLDGRNLLELSYSDMGLITRRLLPAAARLIGNEYRLQKRLALPQPRSRLRL